MPTESEEVEDQSLTPQQEARAKLRESFLRSIHNLTGQPCKILTYEQSYLEATFSAWNPDGSEVLVRDMKTPACDRVASALLRTPDILAVQFVNKK